MLSVRVSTQLQLPVSWRKGKGLHEQTKPLNTRGWNSGLTSPFRLCCYCGFTGVLRPSSPQSGGTIIIMHFTNEEHEAQNSCLKMPQLDLEPIYI